MSYVKIWVHAVWGTKNRERILTKEIRKQLFQHIKDNAKEKEIYIDFINGYLEHVHCLLTLNADMSVAKTLQLIKGESSFWSNRNKIVQPSLTWADDYFAVSISEKAVDKVRDYIKNQEEHHRNVTFAQEYEKFMKAYGFESHG